ncbi:MAG: hypothetical protein ACHQ15_01425 [Candidatus Limnocylindrales bacterium]
MPPIPARAAALIVVALLLAACAGADEQRLAGFYPDLEALLPAAFEGVAPASLDSGRYCSANTLGSLLAAGVSELHFAGATWPDQGGQTGLAIVVYRAPGLTADAVADSFASGAGEARGVNQVHALAIEVAGVPGVSITAMSGDRPQIVIIRPFGPAGTVAVVIGSGVDEARVLAAAQTFGGP